MHNTAPKQSYKAFCATLTNRFENFLKKAWPKSINELRGKNKGIKDAAFETHKK